VVHVKGGKQGCAYSQIQLYAAVHLWRGAVHAAMAVGYASLSLSHLPRRLSAVTLGALLCSPIIDMIIHLLTSVVARVCLTVVLRWPFVTVLAYVCRRHSLTDVRLHCRSVHTICITSSSTGSLVTVRIGRSTNFPLRICLYLLVYIIFVDSVFSSWARNAIFPLRTDPSTEPP